MGIAPLSGWKGYTRTGGRDASVRRWRKHTVFGSSPLDTADLWEALVEKAFAKMHGGYNTLQFVTLADALAGLTGGIVFEMSLNVPLSTASAAASLPPPSLSLDGMIAAAEARYNAGDILGVTGPHVRLGTIVEVKKDNAERWLMHEPWGMASSAADGSVGEMVPSEAAPAFGTRWLSAREALAKRDTLLSCRMFRDEWSVVSGVGTIIASPALGAAPGTESSRTLHSPLFIITVQQETESHLLIKQRNATAPQSEPVLSLEMVVFKMPVFEWDAYVGSEPDVGTPGVSIVESPQQGLSLEPIGGVTLALHPEFVYFVRPTITASSTTSTLALGTANIPTTPPHPATPRSVPTEAGTATKDLPQHVNFLLRLYSSKFCVTLEPGIWDTAPKTPFSFLKSASSSTATSPISSGAGGSSDCDNDEAEFDGGWGDIISTAAGHVSSAAAVLRRSAANTMPGTAALPPGTLANPRDASAMASLPSTRASSKYPLDGTNNGAATVWAAAGRGLGSTEGGAAVDSTGSPADLNAASSSDGSAHNVAAAAALTFAGSAEDGDVDAPTIEMLGLSAELAGLLHDTPALEVRIVRITKLESDPGLGVTLFSPKEAVGVRISRVKMGGPSSRAENLMIGDVLLEVNGAPLFSVDRRSRRWYGHNEVVEALVRAGDEVVILVASEETLNNVSAPLAQARTAEERQAFVEGGRVRLCTSNPRMLAMLATTRGAEQVAYPSYPDPELSRAEHDLKQKFVAGTITRREYDSMIIAARAQSKIKDGARRYANQQSHDEMATDIFDIGGGSTSIGGETKSRRGSVSNSSNGKDAFDVLAGALIGKSASGNNGSGSRSGGGASSRGGVEGSLVDEARAWWRSIT